MKPLGFINISPILVSCGVSEMLKESLRARLLKQLALLSSDYQGEQIAAIRGINRTLKSANLSWNDFIQIFHDSDSLHAYDAGFENGFAKGYGRELSEVHSESLYSGADKHYQMLLELERHHSSLNSWSRDFVDSVLTDWFRAGNGKRISPKQAATIERIYKNVCG